ncbi:MAG: hypothetical protein ABW098_19160 [Candidatus Thiodiazotropha sp.]
MATPQSYEIASVIAAVVSAVGGCAAAIAAFRSADSARLTAKAAYESSRRESLREISSLATTIETEIIAARSVAGELNAEYRTAEILAGTTNNSSIERMRSTTNALAEKASSFSNNAQPFAGGAIVLNQAPPDEIHRVHVRLSDDLAKIRVIREELARKCSAMRDTNNQSRIRS